MEADFAVQFRQVTFEGLDVFCRKKTGDMGQAVFSDDTHKIPALVSLKVEEGDPIVFKRADIGNRSADFERLSCKLAKRVGVIGREEAIRGDNGRLGSGSSRPTTQ